jgi:tRNA nucleotidyltransferase (CCA-adding enzyme)
MIKILEPHFKKKLKTLLTCYEPIQSIINDIAKSGGRTLLVGGAVRDLLLDLEVKDLDIEVHGLSLEQLENILKKYGPVSLVGKAFGVLRLHSLDVDWALPRTDGSGRKPQVTIDPHMKFERAFARRDLTINAMGIDLINFELIDPFQGFDDLQKKVLRATDPEFFIEDPLRFYRVMQFVGRFEMVPDKTLNQICKTMDVSTVSRERIEKEFEKLFLKSKRPSLGIRWVYELSRLKELFPEIAALVGVPQDPQWHPEGDVFEHAMQSMDAIALYNNDSEKTKLILLWAALCHDLGKADTTKLIDGRWKSYEHDQEGSVISRQMLQRITNNQELITTVSKLVKFHVMPGQFVRCGASPAAYKRLAKKLAPEVTLQMLADLALADRRGRNPKKNIPLDIVVPDIEAFLHNAERLQVRTQIEEPILYGKDFIGIMEPGPQMGELLKQAYEIQIEQGIQDKEELKQRVLKVLLKS